MQDSPLSQMQAPVNTVCVSADNTAPPQVPYAVSVIMSHTCDLISNLRSAMCTKLLWLRSVEAYPMVHMAGLWCR